MSEQDKPLLKSLPDGIPSKLNYPAVALHEILTQAAKDHPEDTAIIFSGQRITYSTLDLFCSKFAASLSSIGVRKGDRVALYLPNIPQFVIAYYGVMKAGAVVTAVSPLHKERELQHQLADSEAETILFTDFQRQIVDEVWHKTLLKRAVVTGMDEFSFQTPRLISNAPDVHSFQSLLETKEEPPRIAIDPQEDLAALQYTGGTTGIAKGAMLTHRNLVANAVAFATWIKGSPAKETFLTALPLFHIYGMTTSLNAPVSLCAKIVLLPKFEPAKAQIIQQYGVTVFCGVPTMYAALLDNPDIDGYDLKSIRVCISGASPLPQPVQKKFMQISGGLLVEGYGLTEASPVTHCSPVDGTLQTIRVGSIGLPLPDTEAKIVDAETGTKTLASGETGELAVKGPQIMKGYWKKLEETLQVLRNGWLLTGDIAHIDADGYFYITDRKKDLIKYKGCSVYPRELEDILYEHPAVKLCAVIGKIDPVAGEIPKAFIVLRQNASITEQEIRTFVNSRVASYKAIREVEFRRELPLSSAGKILRRSLREETTKPA